jgi:glycosyltransferase involved in cell wall biosynthesis
MARITSLHELAQGVVKDLTSDEINSLRFDADIEKQIRGTLLQSAKLLRQGRREMALTVLLGAQSRLGFLPTVLISGIIELCCTMGMEQRAALECLAFAHDSMNMGYCDLALESCSAALILDGMSSFEIIRNPASLRRISGWYETVACGLESSVLPAKTAVRRASPRIGLMVPNVVDDTVANTKTLLHLVRHMDKTRCNINVYVTENLSHRESPLFPYGCREGTSEHRGSTSLKAIRDCGASVHIAGRHGSFSQSALSLAQRIACDQLDVLIVQSGLACPIDWLATRLAPIPVKMTIHNGTSLYMPGMDVNFYDNPFNLDRESGSWDPSFGQRVVLAQGTDIEWIRAQPALPRSRFGIPQEALVVGTLSNHLDERLSKGYMELIADVLEIERDAWFVAFGNGRMSAAADYFASRGVSGRVRFGGGQINAGSALKILDIYANEFPVGGSQSVVEAMACGIPVVALRWSDAHAESAGFNAVGAPYGIIGRDVGEFRQRLLSWIRNTAERNEVAVAMSRRAQDHFSVRNYARTLQEVGTDTAKRKMRESGDKPADAPFRGVLASMELE